MASTNQSPFYKKAEAEFFMAQSDEERIEALKVMIKECPKHKSSEKMLANLKTRLIKLEKSVEKQKKSRKSSTKQGIKKSDMQAVLIGFTNSGKSSFFNLLTGLDAKVSPYQFNTTAPQLGTIDFEDIKVQLIDMPSFPNIDRSLINSTDVLLLVIDNLDQIEKSREFWGRSRAKVFIIFNKADLLDSNELRRVEANLKSKHKNHVYFILSSLNPDEQTIKDFKKKLFSSFPIIRVYTKEPRKPATKDPMILKQGATLEEASEKILKGMSKRVERARVWGPSSKFSGQAVGLDHVLKDGDVVEFQIK